MNVRCSCRLSGTYTTMFQPPSLPPTCYWLSITLMLLLPAHMLTHPALAAHPLQTVLSDQPAVRHLHQSSYNPDTAPNTVPSNTKSGSGHITLNTLATLQNYVSAGGNGVPLIPGRNASPSTSTTTGLTANDNMTGGSSSRDSNTIHMNHISGVTADTSGAGVAGSPMNASGNSAPGIPQKGANQVHGAHHRVPTTDASASGRNATGNTIITGNDLTDEEGGDTDSAISTIDGNTQTRVEGGVLVRNAPAAATLDQTREEMINANVIGAKASSADSAKVVPPVLPAAADRMLVSKYSQDSYSHSGLQTTTGTRGGSHSEQTISAEDAAASKGASGGEGGHQQTVQHTTAPPVSSQQCPQSISLPKEWRGDTLMECTLIRGTPWCSNQAGIWRLCPTFKGESGSGNSFPHATRKAPNVIINEVMWTDLQPLHDEDDQPNDWLELHNLEDTAVNLQGWWLSDSPSQPYMWQLPSMELGPGSFLIVFASGKNRTGKYLHTNFRLKSDGEFLSLMRPDKTFSSVIGPDPASQVPGFAYGAFDLSVLQDRQSSASGPRLAYALLDKPTPAAPNAGPLMKAGPFISRSQHNPAHGPIQPNEDVAVEAEVTGVLAAVTKVTLVYRVNFEQAVEISMQETGVETTGGRVFKAQIQGNDHKAGDLVRWFIQAEDALGGVSRLPAGPTDPAKPQWFGTMVQARTTAPVPTLFWWTEFPDASLAEKGARGSIFYNDTLYDNVLVKRRGVTALGWAKPKLKVKLYKDVFKWKPGVPRVDEFSLQSFFFELGEKSYMKEVVGLQVMKEAGVIAPESFHIQVAQNGKFFGLFAYIQDIDNQFLETNGLSPQGPLFKAVHGEMSNLRWDIPVEELKFYYGKGNRKGVEADWQLLAQLSKGLAGGGPGSRTSFMFDNLYMPQIINEMAAQTLLNNMDRCTKNFYLYRDDKSEQWYRFPWDMDGALGQSNGLGGKSATDYCVLVCEQWNSPLYCDSEHPQDALKETPWGTVTVTLVAENMRPANVNRRLQQAVEQISTRPKDYRPTDWSNPDRSTINEKSVNGVAGTYNHLNDAILDVPSTREMYMRRLRSLTDQFLTGGRMEQIVNETYQRIVKVAEKDNKKWSIGDINRGYLQIITEYIPIRRQQLLELYGPSGTEMSLLPDSQPSEPLLELHADPAGGEPGGYIQIVNKSPYAVDLSGWKLALPDNKEFWIPAGAVVPTGRSLHITSSVPSFKAKQQKGGLLVIQGLSAPLKSQAGVQLMNGRGSKVASI